MRKILVSAISFVNHTKNGSEIYTTFAKRLISDVLTKTPYDVMISTNELSYFEDYKSNNRVLINYCTLGEHKTNVFAFNQLLKFYAIKDIDRKYDWVLYLDCDAGFTERVDEQAIENYLSQLDSLGYDMSALRTDATYDLSKKDFIDSGGRREWPKPLFNDKFIFYGINDDWSGAKFPSEHILLIKNNEKLNVMTSEFEKFCYKFESQNESNVITYDMEAFEIGVSAHLAKYNMCEMTWNRQCDLFKVGFNYNNWEKIKR
jgi:hypothetical protein